MAKSSSSKRGSGLLFEPVRKHIPIYVASISPTSMARVGEAADGLDAHLLAEIEVPRR
ncbi:MAG: hypothetical protein R3C29_00695 [Dehalococcoidia bacterium]